MKGLEEFPPVRVPRERAEHGKDLLVVDVFVCSQGRPSLLHELAHRIQQAALVRSTTAPWLRTMAKSSVPRVWVKPLKWPLRIATRSWPQCSSGSRDATGGQL